MLGIYLLYLGFLVYMHKFVYILGEKLLLQFFKDGTITTETLRRISNENILNVNVYENKNENNKNLHDKEINDKDINNNETITFTPYKRKYIIKNIWKSFILLIILIGASIQFLDGFINNVWSNLSFKTWGTVYVALDLSGLIYVKGLPIATVIHHVVVNILGFVNAQTDYNLPGYYRSILIYTYFYIIPFLVNFYLGYRYLDTNEYRKKKLAYYAYRLYQISLFLNIFSQIIFFITEPFHYSIVFYFVLYCLILNDDIKLILFLKRESHQPIIDKVS
jgi:hypothetical protein